MMTYEDHLEEAKEVSEDFYVMLEQGDSSNKEIAGQGRKILYHLERAVEILNDTEATETIILGTAIGLITLAVNKKEPAYVQAGRMAIYELLHGED